MKIRLSVLLGLLISQFAFAQNKYNFSKYFTKQEVGDCLQFGQVNNAGTGYYTTVRAWCHYGNQLFFAEYRVAATSYGNNNQDWAEVVPVLSTGWNGAQNFALDVRYKCVHGCPLELRLRRLTGGYGGEGTIYFEVETNSSFQELDIQTSGGVVVPGYLASDAGWKFPVTNQSFAASTQGLFIQPNGDVGINTTTPANRFQVNSDNNGTGAANWIAGNFGGTAGDRVVMGVLRGTASVGAHNNSLNAWSNLAINPEGGYVGIGTLTPSEMLSVKGKIRAQEIKVEMTGWPDFVFAKEYKLPSLADVEKYIKANNHLPEIPSAKEVEAEGVSLGEMNKKLLQKIEELTLYMIELKKEVNKQNHKIKELESAIK